MNLFAELKRRNVFRVGIFYIVAAWVVVQVAETLLPVFDVPDTAIRIIVLVLALGFPIALVFAWAFELTPEGLKRDKNAHVDPETKQQTARKLDVATLIAAVLAIGIVVVDRYLPSDRAAPAQPTSQLTPDDSTGSATIAVLPFVNMSPDADNAYFADGISEELLNILAGIEGLDVASRTSAFSFRGDSTPIPQIAQALGVRYILEGSVRKQGDRVRITSQLIDAQSDVHMWSDTYERELTDIFRVQENIAQAITSELTGLLVQAPVNVKVPTANLQAYQLFLRGRSLFYQRRTLDEAIRTLREAVELDPSFGQAWAFLAASQYVVSEGGYETRLDYRELARRATISVERAMQLDDSIPIAQAVRGRELIKTRQPALIEQGLQLLEDAANAVSPDSTPKMWFGLTLLDLGQTTRAIDTFSEVVDQDPLVAINNGYLGVALATNGQHEEAARYAFRSLELSGVLTYWVNMVSFEAVYAGEFERALAITNAARERLAMGPGDPVMTDIYELFEAGAPYEEFLERHPTIESSNADFYRTTAAMMLGNIDEALTFSSSPNLAVRNLLTHAAWMPPLIELREHPEFYAFVDELGMVGYWRRNGFPLDCRESESQGLPHLACGGTP